MDASAFSAWRRRMGITQEELAERWARVTRTTIQNWESGATPIPQAVDAACGIWERRLKQENPTIGPVTLVFADGPMFIDPYGPRRPLATMRQEPYPSNAAAIARVMELAGRKDFHNPFIIEKSGGDLWNAVELDRVARAEDPGAPTLVNLLRRLARHVTDTSAQYVRSGSRMPSQQEVTAKQRRIESLAAEIDSLADAAAQSPVSYSQVEQCLLSLRALGKFPPDALVSGIAHALVRST